MVLSRETHVRYATQQHKSTAKMGLNVRQREEHFGKDFKAGWDTDSLS